MKPVLDAATAVAVAAAGAAGTLARWALAMAVPRTARLPWATLAVNVVGAFAIGAVVAALGSRGLADHRLRTVVTTGFLGVFTTYSAFALETVQLAESGHAASAAAYVALTLVAGLAACWAGLVVGRMI